MDSLIIAIRAVHFAGAISLAGIFGFVALVATAPPQKLQRALRQLSWISIALVALSGPLRLLSVGHEMTGYGFADMVVRGTVREVLAATQFGHASLVRSVLLVALIPFVVMLGRYRSRDLIGMIVAAAGLAAIAWQGHAGADTGWDGVIHLGADAGHLVAAGLWLGALLPLALQLRDASDVSAQYGVVKRFSALGVACVATLLASGAINSWYLVGSIPALLGTGYGQVLLAKLALVVAMLCLAVYNRWRLVPRLAAGNGAGAARRLSRHSMIEAALGVAVIAIVAALGTMIPAAHQAIVWPFGVRFGLDAIALEPTAATDVIVSATFAVIGLLLLGFAIYRRYWLVVVFGALLSAGLGVHVTEWVLVAATPTSYQRSPEPFTAATIAVGDALYRENCVSCHGPEGHGDGPLGAELPITPADLTAHLAMHPEGDLYSFIADGMDGGVMPRFRNLDAKQRWDLVVFLEAQQQAFAASSTLLALVNASATPRAPDFVLPEPQDGATTLAALLKQGGALLVFATLPQSQARLDEIAGWRSALRDTGIATIVLTDTPELRDAYALYDRRPQIEDAAPAAHIEFLIDRNDYIRARWRPGDIPDWTQLPALQREIAAMSQLESSPPAAEPSTTHVHDE